MAKNMEKEFSIKFLKEKSLKITGMKTNLLVEMAYYDTYLVLTILNFQIANIDYM